VVAVSLKKKRVDLLHALRREAAGP
jgi:hypothetical protein